VLILRTITTVPAIVAIGMWFLFQVVSGIGLLGGSETGVAYGAHIGGFVAGLVLVKVFMLGIDPDPRPQPRGL
jgi:membrane associated rhomboid family serine protease